MCLAIPGQLEEIFVQDDMRMGRVNFGGVKKSVCLQCVPGASPGEYVLVHVGMAISVIDQDEARRTLKLLEEAGELQELQ